MTEEQVTKAILNWLEINGWEIICFDFPQSGTGVSLHPNIELRTTKNKGAFIPDIVAIKNETVIFFENKDRFVFTDFIKVEYLKNGNDYSSAIQRLLKDYNVQHIFYGVGIAHSEITEQRILDNVDKIDFAISCLDNNLMKVVYDPSEILKSNC